MDELWIRIREYPDYCVSSLGNVRRFSPDMRGRISGKNLAPILGNHGYYIVSLHEKGMQTTKTIHRLVCEAFHGAPESPHYHAAHKDGDRLNNKASNLRWASSSENNLDKNRHGTMMKGEKHTARINSGYLPRGEDHKGSKLTREDVIQIRSSKEPQKKISAKFGVSQSLISMIRCRKIWQHV